MLSNLFDLPAVLYLQVQACQVSPDLCDRFLEILFACPYQQHIVHIPEIVPDILDSVTSPLFVEPLLHKMIQIFQVKIREPRRCVISDRAWYRCRINDLTEHIQDVPVLDLLLYLPDQDVPIYRVIEFPDVQLHEIPAFLIRLEPPVDIRDDVLDPSSRNAPAAMRMHPFCEGLHRHLHHQMRYQVIF